MTSKSKINSDLPQKKNEKNESTLKIDEGDKIEKQAENSQVVSEAKIKDEIEEKNVEIIEVEKSLDNDLLDNTEQENKGKSKFSKQNEEQKTITYYRLGIEHPIEENADEIQISCGRIPKIENLEKLKNLKSLMLISNLIRKIENLEENINLVHLELYQNFLTKIENISHLVNLRVLDLSFNNIRKIENLSTLVNLEKLYLSSNKITEIEGLEKCLNLEILELGCNRIREIKGIDMLHLLRELWLGKNKISCFNICFSLKLEILSVQSNRLEVLNEKALENSPNLKELYLSHNMLKCVPKQINLENLLILDLGNNVISDLSFIKNVQSLKELWINNNKIESVENVKELCSLKNLTTLYLEHNPLQYKLGPAYRNAILAILPNLIQLDAILVSNKQSH